MGAEGKDIKASDNMNEIWKRIEAAPFSPYDKIKIRQRMTYDFSDDVFALAVWLQQRELYYASEVVGAA